MEFERGAQAKLGHLVVESDFPVPELGGPVTADRVDAPPGSGGQRPTHGHQATVRVDDADIRVRYGVAATQALRLCPYLETVLVMNPAEEPSAEDALDRCPSLRSTDDLIISTRPPASRMARMSCEYPKNRASSSSTGSASCLSVSMACVKLGWVRRSTVVGRLSPGEGVNPAGIGRVHDVPSTRQFRGSRRRHAGCGGR